MTFTDEDLKRLKEREYRCPCGNILCPAPIDFKALLSRLEAAEKVCKAAGKMVVDCNHKPSGWDETDNAYYWWRNAAGK